MNCSLPWTNDYQTTFQKCGNDDQIQSLIDLVERVDNMEDAIMEELGDFGCLIPNCEETFWRYYAQDQYYDERFEGFSNVRFFFPSKKVTYFNFQTIHRMIRNQVLFVIVNDRKRNGQNQFRPKPKFRPS